MFVAVRRLGLVLGVLGVLAAAVACGGGGAPPRSLPPITSTTPAAVSTHAPAHTRTADLAAVKAVVREYYELLNAPTTVANARELAQLVTPACSCQAVVTATMHAARERLEYFGHNTLRSVRVSLDSSDSADALVTYDYSAGGLRTRDGTVLRRDRGGRGATVDLRLTRAGQRWLITAILQIRSGTTP